MPNMINASDKIDYRLVNKSEIARRLNLSQTYVHLIINGKRHGKKAKFWLRKIQEIVEDKAA